MARYKIIYKKNECIGAAVCEAILPERWVLQEDGKAILKNAKKIDEDTYELEIEADESQLKLDFDAAEGCPVRCIHIINLDTGEQLV